MVRYPKLLGFLVRSMDAAKPAVLLELQLLWCVFLVLGGRIIALFALGARKRDNVSHLSRPLKSVTSG